MSRSVLLFSVLLAFIVCIIAVTSTITDNAWWIQLVCWGIFILSIAAIVESLTTYIVLEHNTFRMRKNFRTVAIPRLSIESVSHAKGCPTQLHLQDGSRIEIPELAGSMANSIRAWLRQTGHQNKG